MTACRIQIAIIGAGESTDTEDRIAHELGREVARAGAILVCGGLGGTMLAACEGAHDAGGQTIGIIPGLDKSEANEHCDIVIPSGMGQMRNFLLVRTADVIIALPGKYGTLSEMAFALVSEKPIVSLGSWDVSADVIKANSPREAVTEALNLLQPKV